MGKTPGKWIKTLLLGKKSPKPNLENESEKLRSAKKEELVVSAKDDDFPNLSVDPPVASSQPDPATIALTVVSAKNDDESKVNLQSGNDLEELELKQAVIKVQAAFRAHQARRAFRTLKGIIRLQAVIRGHLVRRQAVATYSCIWGIVKFQALFRGQKARSLNNGIRFLKTPMEAVDSEALQLSMYSWMDNPPKFFIVDKLLASSPTALPLKIQYGPEEPNSSNAWLDRWQLFQVWSPGSRAASILVPKSKTKKRTYQAVIETEKARPKRGVKKQSFSTSGNGSNHSTTESEKPKQNVRKASTLSKYPLRAECDKAKHNLRKSRSPSSQGSHLEVKNEKHRPSFKRSSLSNRSEKATCRSADTADSVQIEPEVKVSEVLERGDAVESAEKEKETADSIHIEPEVKVSDVLEEGQAVESTEKEKDSTDVVLKELLVVKEENSPEEAEPRTAETSDLKCPDVKVSSENGYIDSDYTKPSERRVSLPAKNDNQDDGFTHSGRKIPSYMAPTASAKARVKGEGSPRFVQEKTEKHGTLRRHSLPSPANGKLSTTTTMSPRAHRLLLASAKGSMNGDKSSSSSKNINDKSNRTEWKR